MRNNYELKGYITNLGKYNEGYLVGKWIDFPIDEEELRQVFKEIEIGDTYEEFFFTDWEQSEPLLRLGEYMNIENLNEAVESIQSLDDDDYTLALAIAEMDGLIDSFDSVDLEQYIFYPDMSLQDVAYELADEMNLPELAIRYFDYDAFARDLHYEGFYETSFGTIECL